MENYEKKYKEALERAKELYSQHCAEWRDEDIEYIFPELAKNKDERIRKALLDAMNDNTPDSIIWDDIRAEEIAAWLEKQGEKPAEWSEEDINMIDWLIRCCEEEHKELCNDKYGHQDIVSDLKRDCRKKWDWLESLKNRVAPLITWKPSDEQMELLIEVQSALLGKDCHNRFTDFMWELKKLKEGKV